MIHTGRFVNRLFSFLGPSPPLLFGGPFGLEVAGFLVWTQSNAPHCHTMQCVKSRRRGDFMRRNRVWKPASYNSLCTYKSPSLVELCVETLGESTNRGRAPSAFIKAICGCQGDFWLWHVQFRRPSPPNDVSLASMQPRVHNHWFYACWLARANST